MVSDTTIGKQICDALGLAGTAVEAIDIRVRPEEAVSVMVRFTPTRDAFGELVTLLKCYKLTDEEVSHAEE